jgi:uncharacterized membrane protein YccC
MVIVNLLDEGDWKVSLLRIGYTAMGGIICLAGGYLLLPDWERTRLPAQIAKAIRANLLYFQRVMDLYIQRAEASVDIDRAQRVAELENANASAATQRLLAEPLHQRGDAESWITVAVYLRGLTNSTTTLAEHAREISAGGALPGLGEIVAAIARALEDLAEMIEKDQQLSIPFQLDKKFTRLRAEVEPGHPEPTRFEDATSASPVFRPSPMPFRSVGLDRQTKPEQRQEIHLRTKSPHRCPVYRRTSQIRVLQNDNSRQPSGGAIG